MTERLIPPSLVHQFRVPCYSTTKKWSKEKGVRLDDRFRLPNLNEIDDRVSFATVWAAWSNEGLFFNTEVTGKRQSLWCRETQLTESDGLQIWIDTRDTHNVHRATRFRHWFLFLPTGGGTKREDPIATMLKINRAKEDAKTLNQMKPSVQVDRKVNGYRMSVFISSRCLSGWDTADHRKIGFNYAMIDRELGYQTMSIGPEFPISEDPSLWQTLELVIQ